MQKIYTILALCLAVCWATPCDAADVYPFTMENGNVIEGTVSDMNEESFIIRRKIGTFSERVDLVYLSQETLKWIQQQPDYIKKGYHEYVDPFIELPEEEIHPPEINVRQPYRMPVPEPRVAFFSTLASPVGLLILMAIYAGNLFAAYEIAVFRGRPVALVCGLSAVMPFIGPILFISLSPEEKVSNYEEVAAPEVLEGNVAATGDTPPPPPPASVAKSGLGLAKASTAGAAAASGGLSGAVFSKDDTNFNRNFIETKFTEFFRVVPSAAIKNLVIAIKTVKREYVVTRITRISAGEMHVKLQQGAQEVSVGFGEIVKIEVRNKGA
ncbi:hypothetical protein OAE97_03265 [Verrucomicrobia bacterium]|nr:hypothetical protein [Verrucomicrobiota bacterium]MDG1892537.1 hypothetical protein [Verrucomicrobiota bacterium]